MMGVAAVVTVADDGRCADMRLSFCSAGETPVLAHEAVQPVIGQSIGQDTLRQLASRVADELKPQGTVHASADYQRHLAGVLSKRAVAQALARVT